MAVSASHPVPAVLGLGAGSEPVVVGAVRRRFFRSGGAPVCRTELFAAAVPPADSAPQVRTALERAARTIGPPS